MTDAAAARRLRYTAALVSGPAELLDFLLPLWAAAQIGGSPAAIGVVVAIEAGVSLAIRPLAGALTDRGRANRVAAAGAAGYALALAVYAVAPGMVTVGLGSVLFGAGGALFWVALRAAVGAGLRHDSAAYARLLSSEQAGSLVAFVVGLTALGSVGYRRLFLAGALSCAVAAVLLRWGGPRRTDAAPPRPRAGTRPRLDRLAPLLAVTALTAGVESGIGLLLLLHLQSEFGLAPPQIALLFLPGSVVLVLLPGRAHPVAVRLGRRRSLLLSLLAAGLCTALLSVLDRPLAVGALWMLSAVTLSVALPVEQATVAQAADGHLGHGVSRYQAAALVGALVATPLLGYGYGRLGWAVSCLAAGAGLVAAAAAVPLALRRLALPDALTPEPVEPEGGPVAAGPARTGGAEEDEGGS